MDFQDFKMKRFSVVKEDYKLLTHIKTRFVTKRKSVGYKVVQEKMPNWTSKGR